MRAKTAGWKRLALAALSALAALALAEGAQRARLAWAGEPYDAAAALAQLERIADPARWYVPEALEVDEDPNGFRPRGLPLLHPYSGSENAHDTGGVLAAFRAGFAAEELSVVVVGGSVAAGWARGEGEALAAALEADPRLAGRRARVLNYAHAAYKQPQQLMRVAYLFSLGYRPDVVVALDGFNEVALTLSSLPNGTHPLYPATPLWELVLRSGRMNDDEGLERAVRLWRLRDEAHATVARARRYGLTRSALVGRLVLGRMRAIERARAAVYDEARSTPALADASRAERSAFRRQLAGPDFERDPAAVLALAARGWGESSISLDALCAARGVRFLQALQPTLHDVGAKPFSADEAALGAIPTGWQEGARDGYPLLRQQLADLAAAGVRVFDASRLFADVEETLYVDHCHVNQLGNRLLTEALAPVLLELLAAPLPERR